VKQFLLSEEAVASPRIGNTLWHVSTTFTRLAITQPDLDEIWGTPSILSGAGADRFWARSAQSESGRASRNFLSAISRTSSQPNFISLHTIRGSMSWWIFLENIFENVPVRGLFFPKRSTSAWTSSMTSDFRPWYLRNEYKSWKVTTGWHAYGMLALHMYSWNQVKVITLACRARTRSVLSNARSCVIYILKKFNSRTLKNLTAEQD